jgi:hypothetical protein
MRAGTGAVGDGGDETIPPGTGRINIFRILQNVSRRDAEEKRAKFSQFLRVSA